MFERTIKQPVRVKGHPIAPWLAKIDRLDREALIRAVKYAQREWAEQPTRDQLDALLADPAEVLDLFDFGMQYLKHLQAIVKAATENETMETIQ